MITVPGETPMITPVPEAAVAIPVLPLAQVPGPVISLRLVKVPAQTLVLPVIAAGDGVKFTVVTEVAAQPLLVAVAV